MQTSITVDLVSSYKKHGSSGAKPKKLRSVASSKLNAIFDLMKRSSATEEGNIDSPSEVEEGQADTAAIPAAGKSSAKPYGSHAGNIQVCHLYQATISSNDGLDEVSNYVANTTSYLESKRGFDLAAAKNSYRHYKDEVTKKYAAKYGSTLSQEATSVFLDELAKQSFTYTQHQIKITIVSDVEIVGARKDPETGLYTLVIKSKMYYSEGKTLIPDSEIQILKGLSKKEVNLRVSKVVRVPAILIWDTKSDRFIVSFDKSDNLMVQDSY